MKRKMVRFIADHKQKLKKLLPKKLLRAAKLAYLKQLMAKYQKEPIHPAEYQKKEAGVNLIGDIREEIGLRHIEMGQKTQLKLKNAKNKVFWETKDKKIATVTTKGMVCAKSCGRTLISAHLGFRTYQCVITVISPKGENNTLG